MKENTSLVGLSSNASRHPKREGAKPQEEWIRVEHGIYEKHGFFSRFNQDVPAVVAHGFAQRIAMSSTPRKTPVSSWKELNPMSDWTEMRHLRRRCPTFQLVYYRITYNDGEQVVYALNCYKMPHGVTWLDDYRDAKHGPTVRCDAHGDYLGPWIEGTLKKGRPKRSKATPQQRRPRVIW